MTADMCWAGRGLSKLTETGNKTFTEITVDCSTSLTVVMVDALLDRAQQTAIANSIINASSYHHH